MHHKYFDNEIVQTLRILQRLVTDNKFPIFPDEK